MTNAPHQSRTQILYILSAVYLIYINDLIHKPRIRYALLTHGDRIVIITRADPPSGFWSMALRIQVRVFVSLQRRSFFVARSVRGKRAHTTSSALRARARARWLLVKVTLVKCTPRSSKGEIVRIFENNNALTPSYIQLRYYMSSAVVIQILFECSGVKRFRA